MPDRDDDAARLEQRLRWHRRSRPARREVVELEATRREAAGRDRPALAIRPAPEDERAIVVRVRSAKVWLSARVLDGTQRLDLGANGGRLGEGHAIRLSGEPRDAHDKGTRTSSDRIGGT